MGAIDAEGLAKALADKIRLLPPASIAEIEDFVDLVVQRAEAGLEQRGLTLAGMQTSERVFAAVWNNPEDEAYDAL